MPPAATPDRPAGGQVSSAGQATGDRPASWRNWGVIATIVTGFVTCAGTVTAAVVPEVIKAWRNDSANSRQTSAPPPPDTVSPTIPSPSPTLRKNSGLSWKLVDTKIEISPGGTNLEFWLHWSNPDLLADHPDAITKADDGHDIMASAPTGQEFVFNPHEPFPLDPRAQPGALAEVTSSPDPDECTAAVTENPGRGVRAIDGGQYCIRSSAGYIYQLTVQSRTVERDGLVVDLRVAVSGSRLFRSEGSR